MRHQILWQLHQDTSKIWSYLLLSKPVFLICYYSRINFGTIVMSLSQSLHDGYRLDDVTYSTTLCTVQSSTYRFFRTLRSLNHLGCCILVILLFCTVCEAHPKDQRVTDSTANRNDFVCNVGDEHECVCGRFNGNLDGKLTECTQFFGVSLSWIRNLAVL